MRGRRQTRDKLSGCRVRIVGLHPRAGLTAVLRGVYIVGTQSWWARVDGHEGLETVVRPSDFEVIG
jgi:hypothetical protein